MFSGKHYKKKYRILRTKDRQPHSSNGATISQSNSWKIFISFNLMRVRFFVLLLLFFSGSPMLHVSVNLWMSGTSGKALLIMKFYLFWIISAAVIRWWLLTTAEKWALVWVFEWGCEHKVLTRGYPFWWIFPTALVIFSSKSFFKLYRLSLYKRAKFAVFCFRKSRK